MSSILLGTRNTRAILPNSLRYIRSDAPVNLPQSDIDWLIRHTICTVVDLRTKEELSKKPSCLEKDVRFTYINLAVTGGDRVPDCAAAVSRSYFSMVDNTMDTIIQTIETAKTNVLYFCNAGKDRTGVVSAILLRNLGYADEYIIEDYLQSADNLKEMLSAYRIANPDIDIDILTPKKQHMEDFLRFHRMQNRMHGPTAIRS